MRSVVLLAVVVLASARASSCVDNTYGEIAVFNNQDAAAALATG